MFTAQTPFRKQQSATPGAPSTAHRLRSAQPQHAPVTGTPSLLSTARTPSAATATAALASHHRPSHAAISTSLQSTLDAAVMMQNDQRAMYALAGGEMPAAVRDQLLLHGDDVSRSPVVAVDASLGCCALASTQSCLVWWWQNHPGGSMLTFPVPVSATMQRPFVVFSRPKSSAGKSVSYGMSTAVGLLLCTADGSLRYWPDIVSSAASTHAPNPQRPTFPSTPLSGRHGATAFMAPQQPMPTLNVHKFKEARIQLGSGADEHITFLKQCPGTGGFFVVGSNTGRLWTVCVVERAAAPSPSSLASCVLIVTEITAAAAAAPGTNTIGAGGLLNRVSGWIMGSTAGKPSLQNQQKREFSAVVLSPTGTHTRDLFVFTDMRVRQLSVNDRSESVQFIAQQNIVSDIRLSIADMLGVSVHDLLAAVIDAQLAKENRMVVLVAYETRNGDQSSLAVVWLDRCTDSESRPRLFSIRMTHLLPADSLHPPGAHKHNETADLSEFRLSLANGGPISFVYSQHVIFLLCLNEIEPYCESIPFRSGIDGYILAADTLTSRIGSLSNDQVSSLWLCYFPMGMLRLDVYLDKIVLPERPTTPTDVDLQVHDERAYAHLKSQLEQAVFFGAKMSNPVEFNIDRECIDELGAAAAQLSLEILRGESKYLTTGNDVKRLLSDRIHSVEEMFMFLDKHGLLEQLRPPHWWKTVTNMEKLAASLGLWQHHNDSVGQQLTSTAVASKPMTESQMVLEHAIQDFLHKKGDRSQGFTGIRKYFSTFIEDIGELLILILKSTEHLSSSWQTGETNQELCIVECNELLKAALNPVFLYRSQNADLMSTFEKKHRSWLGSVDLANSLYRQFELTNRAVTEFARIHQLDILGSSFPEFSEDEVAFNPESYMQPEVILARLKSQLLSIGEYTLNCHFELFIDSGSVARLNLEAAFSEVTKQVVMAIARIGFLNAAYEISEKYRNFPILIDLIHEYGGDVEEQLDRYIQTYGNQFAKSFYDWLILKGDLRRLLSLKSNYNETLSAYFQSGNRQDLLWIHHVRCENYEKAYHILMQQIPHQRLLEHQETMISLAKLIYLAAVEATTDNFENMLSQSSVAVCNSWLDMVACQRHYREKLNSILEKEYPRSIGSASDKATSLAALLAPIMKNKRPILSGYFTMLLMQMLAGEVMSLHQLVDLLTINFGDASDDDDRFILAAEMIAIAPGLSAEDRDEMSRVVLRRATLHSGSYFMHLGNQLDTQMASQLRESLLYKLRDAYSTMNLPSFPSVTELRGNELGADTVKSIHPNLKDAQIEDVLTEYLQESILLDHLMQNYRLSMYYNEITVLLQQSSEMNTD